MSTVLAGLVLAGLMPMGVLAGILLALNWTSQQQHSREEVASAARTVALAVDRQLASTVRRLSILAASPWMADDLAASYANATRALQLSPDWSNLVLIASDGRQLINVNRPFRVPLPDPPRRDYREKVFETGAPAVSQLLLGPLSDDWVVQVAVPVLRDGSVRYVLEASLRLDAMADLLADYRARPQFHAMLVDSAGRLMAVANASERTRATAQAVDVAGMNGETGTAEIDRAGTPVVAAWAAVPFAGWKVVVDLPVAVIDAPLQRHASIGAFVWFCVLTITGGLAIVGARRLSTWISAASNAAEQVSRGGNVTLPTPPVQELAQLRDALDRASMRLRAEAEQRAIAEAARDELLDQERGLREAAERDSRAKDAFLAMLGHELKNPIGAISNAAHVLASPEGSRHVAWASSILLHQARHSQKLIEDLVDTGRVLIGKLHLSLAAVDLDNVVRSAVAALQASGRTGKHRVRVDLRAVKVLGDSFRLEQVIVNLLGNALKYTPPGGQVLLMLRAHDDRAVLRVKDNGIGIRADLLPYVFDLFVQDEERHGGKGGMGIGLALARRIIELHGGTITAESAGPDQGTTIIVTLPLAPASDDAFDPSSEGRILRAFNTTDAVELRSDPLHARAPQAPPAG